MSSARRSTLGLLIAAGVVTSACATSVNRILADPSRYRDREVRVSGHVVDSVSLGDRGVYRLEDRSGSLWVVSEHGVPRKGAEVTTKGRVRDGFNFSVFGARISLPASLGSGLILQESSHSAR